VDEWLLWGVCCDCWRWPITESRFLQAPSAFFRPESSSDATVPPLQQLPFSHRREVNRIVWVAERHGQMTAYGFSEDPIVGNEHTSQGGRLANQPDVVNEYFVQVKMFLETPACSGASR
jgi:hypothetical protein